MTFVIFEQSLREISRGTCSDVHTELNFEAAVACSGVTLHQFVKKLHKMIDIVGQMSCFESHSPVIRSNQQPDHEILQVYLTTWLAEVNIDTHRVDEIFAVIGEEMHVGLP
ncbi:hypothetical protein CK203_105376 [Vitis vinifera]|uniref:Uncharacterized protein n=1 Tax=Vitis vinifera TaxID=29760 RepID=A0A438FET4_VITVI|nr:hypothetical protein CK203_105376 [Vitis vinifera]